LFGDELDNEHNSALLLVEVNGVYALFTNFFSRLTLSKIYPLQPPYASKEVGLEVNAEKTRYILLSRHQNAGQNHNIKISNSSFKNVAHFKYLGTTVTNQNLIQEKIKWRLNSSNTCYDSVQNIVSSRLLSKKVKIRMYRTIIFPAVLYGCETWSVTLREEYRLKGFEHRVLRKIFGPKRNEVIGRL
jgi:hypothetical protein